MLASEISALSPVFLDPLLLEESRPPVDDASKRRLEVSLSVLNMLAASVLQRPVTA